MEEEEERERKKKREKREMAKITYRVVLGSLEMVVCARQYEGWMSRWWWRWWILHCLSLLGSS